MSAKKDNSIKSTLRYVYLALAVILASSSLFVLTIINQLLNPSLYTNALDKSGFYSVTTSIIEDKATDALLSLEEQLLVRIGIFEGDSENPLLNSLLVWVVGSFLDDATEQLVINVSDDINLKGVIKDASEGVINGGVLWFRGDSPDPEIFAYIPDPERILEIGEASVADVVYVGAIEALGISTLPQCVDDTQINENLQKLARGNLLDLTCTNTTIEPLALAEVEKYIPRESLESAEATIQGFLVMFGLDTVLDQLYQIALGVSVIKQAALGLRDFVRGTIDLSILAYITSFAFLGLGLYVTEKGNKIKTLLRSYLIVGALVSGASIFHYYGFARGLNANIDYNAIIFAEGFLDPIQRALLIQSIREAGFLVIRDTLYLTTRVGLLIFFVTTLPLLVIKFSEVRRNLSTKSK